MKKFLFLAAFIVATSTVDAQVVASFSVDQTGTYTKNIAEGTTYKELPRLIKVVSTNQSIAVGLMNSVDAYADEAVYKYTVQSKTKGHGKRKVKYYEYCILIYPNYKNCVLNYFDSLRGKPTSPKIGV